MRKLGIAAALLVLSFAGTGFAGPPKQHFGTASEAATDVKGSYSAGAADSQTDMMPAHSGSASHSHDASSKARSSSLDRTLRSNRSSAHR
jgi:hypothetical protein